MKVNKLPNKPSSLLRLAMNDADHLISLGVRINMSAWVRMLDDKVCTVCLGGAALVSNFSKKDYTVYSCGTYNLTSPKNLSNEDEKIEALNNFRLGEILDGVGTFYGCEYSRSLNIVNKLNQVFLDQLGLQINFTQEVQDEWPECSGNLSKEEINTLFFTLEFVAKGLEEIGH